MKKILSLAVCAALVVSSAFTQVLTKAGVQNTLWTGFGEQYPEAGKSPDVRFYGLYETLQARVDVSQFTIEAMLNWAAETNWEFNEFQNITFANTQKTPFYYTNHSGQGGDKTSGYTDSLYVNFLWNAIAKNKHDLDFGMGTRLSWVIGPAPSCYGCYWEPLTHIPQGGLKEGAPGSADVAGYTSYDNNYADTALGIRYRYSDFIEAGISIPSGVTTDKPFFNAAFAIKPMDVFRASVALENIGNDSTDLYTGLSLYFSKVTVDAYFEFEDFSGKQNYKTWGTGATVTFFPIKKLMVRPEAGVSVFKDSNYTPAVYAGGRLEYSINEKMMVGGFTSFGWGSKDRRWEDYKHTEDYTGGFVFDIRPDFTYSFDKHNSISAAFDYQFRKAFNNDDYSVWAAGVYWTYKN